MTKTQLKKATKTVYTILKQIARWIPRDIVKDAAERHGIRYRTFDPWSHLVTLLVVQLSHERKEIFEENRRSFRIERLSLKREGMGKWSGCGAG